MPWKVQPVSEIRTAFVHHLVTLGRSVAATCRDFGISRATAYKWLGRYRARPDEPLDDRPRRPHRSPGRTGPEIEDRILEVRDRWGWGPRKIHAYLTAQGLALPSARTVGSVLHRHGRTAPRTAEPSAVQRFERGAPNELWQCDFKGYLEVARQRTWPFALLDDHSRYLLALRPCPDQTMATAWAVLWDTFGAVGLPEALLCDGAFAARGPGMTGLSWFEARLIRLGIRPVHGRPYHPQTQGKVERLNGTLEAEVWPRVRWDDPAHFAADLEAWRSGVYNAVRPHEALGDRPPLSRWRPSPRPRPAELPAVEYPAGSEVRKVSTVGDVRWQGYRLLAGRGIIGKICSYRRSWFRGSPVLRHAPSPVRGDRVAPAGGHAMMILSAMSLPRLSAMSLPRTSRYPCLATPGCGVLVRCGSPQLGGLGLGTDHAVIGGWHSDSSGATKTWFRSAPTPDRSLERKNPKSMQNNDLIKGRAAC
jgi:transposase InsO family protein